MLQSLERIKSRTVEEKLSEIEDEGIENILITRKQICNYEW